MISFQAQCIHESAQSVQFDPPNHCPICHHVITPRVLLAVFKRPSSAGKLQVVLQCTRTVCDSIFLSYYSTPLQMWGGYKFERSVPLTPQEEPFSKEIIQLSPLFVAIYNQSLAAEAANLEHLTGIGLRKALEFLIKDLAIQEHPNDQTAIQSTPLGACIEKFIDDGNVKECAKRAAWLGNDETHYVRKWTNKDANDLKALIGLTIQWIKNLLLTRKYMAEMK